MAHVVITGGAGFLGTHLTRAFLDRGDSVLCIDNLCTGDRDNLAPFLDDARYTFREHDISEPFTVDEPVDAVCNFASPASPPGYLALPIETLRVGSLGTTHALEVARVHGARFLTASTSEVYGDPHVHPQPESYWGHVNPIGPRSVYDEAKRFGEAMTMAYHRTYGVDTRLVRIFNTYGPNMRADDGRVVSNFIVQALQGSPITIYGAGDQTRSFCFVEDEVRGFLALLDADGIHDPVNIGNPNEFTILELANVVLDVLDSKSELVYEALPQDDPMQRKPDITRARELLGWEPVVQLREGVERTAAYFAERLGL